jgi:hypothetical protein
VILAVIGEPGSAKERVREMDYRRFFSIVLAVGLLAVVLVACQTDGPNEEAFVPPTATTQPTYTPLATYTALPTYTLPAPQEPLPTYTALPTYTPYPSPTVVPEDTATPTATATNTPTVTPTPDGTTTSQVGATPTYEIFILYYESDPTEVLGVFLIKPFNGQELYEVMTNARDQLAVMQDVIFLTEDDPLACATYIAAYNSIRDSGVVYDQVPGTWVEVYRLYVPAFIMSLDRTRPAYLSCVQTGQVSPFNASLASTTIEQALQMWKPAIDGAEDRLGL